MGNGTQDACSWVNTPETRSFGIYGLSRDMGFEGTRMGVASIIDFHTGSSSINSSMELRVILGCRLG